MSTSLDELTPSDSPPFVSIFCDDTHRDRPWKIATFVRPTFGGRAMAWSEQIGSYLEDDETMSIAGRAEASLVESRPVDSELTQEMNAISQRDRHSGNVPTVRTRFAFECKLCRRRVEGRLENLSPILDTLATHGVSTLSLQGLAVILKKHGTS